MYDTLHEARTEAQVKSKLYQSTMVILRVLTTTKYVIALSRSECCQVSVPNGYKLVETVRPDG